MTIVREELPKVVSRSFEILLDKLSGHGSSMDSYSASCFRMLVDHFDKGLRGILDPAYYLSSLPPGYGKTEAIVSFVKAWKAAGFNPQGGILIGLQSKDQISALVKRLGLLKSELGILTRDVAINELGCGVDRANEARILITTQQMISSRTRNSSFSKTKDFFYDGKPRGLRIWDESILLAKSIAIKISAIHSLYAAFDTKDAFFAEQLAAFANGLTLEKVGSQFVVGGDLAALAAARWNADREAKAFGRPHLPSLLGRTLEAIRDAGERSLLLASYGGKNSGLTLVGAGRPLPDDLAPAIVLDASGRVRGTYELMEQAKRNLIRLPSPQGNFANLELRVWRTGCGRGVLRDDDANRQIFRGVADAIMTKPDEDWLIIGKKDDCKEDKLGVQALVEASLPKGFTGELLYLHWGSHMATNDYAHIRNVVVVGTIHYGNAGYDSLAAAATGGAPVKGQGKPLIVSEAQHNLLQAVMRSNARNSINGVCGNCIAYLVVSPDISEDAMRSTFPGARVKMWKNRINPLSSEAKRLVDYLEKEVTVGSSIGKGVACDAVSINRKSLSNMLDKPALQNALAKIGVAATYRTFDKSNI